MFDVFISYRRSDGADIARILKMNLSQRGVSVFIDVDDTYIGEDFPSRLAKSVSEAKHFLLILTPDYLKIRDVDKDWVLEEIRQALKSGKKVIPILTNQFVYPEENDIPDDLLPILTMNAIRYSHEFCDQVMDKLASVIIGGVSQAVKRTNKKKSDLISIIKGREISPEQIRQASVIENLVYDGEDFIAGPEVYLKWFEESPDSFVLAIDKGKGLIVGALIFLPLIASAYDAMRQGNYVDTGIEKKDILSLDLPDTYDIYVTDVMIAPDYQKWSKALTLMVEGFIGLLIEKVDQDIFVKRVLADVCSSDGARLTNYFDMKLIRETSHSSAIYELEMLPPTFLTKTSKARVLKAIYSSYFDEFGSSYQ